MAPVGSISMLSTVNVDAEMEVVAEMLLADRALVMVAAARKAVLVVVISANVGLLVVATAWPIATVGVEP